MEAVLANSYNQLAIQVKPLLLWGELRGGLMSEGQSVPSDASRIMRGDITDINSLIKWSDLYKLINGVNQILKFAPQVRDYDPSFSLAELRQIESEALFLRALSYFYLVRAFKEVPLILEPYTSDGQDFTRQSPTSQQFYSRSRPISTRPLTGQQPPLAPLKATRAGYLFCH